MDEQWMKGQMHGTSAPADLFSSRNGILPVSLNGSKVSSKAVLVLSFLEPISLFCAPQTCLSPFHCRFRPPPHLCAFTCPISPMVWMDFSWAFILHHFSVFGTCLHGETCPPCLTVNCIWVFLVISALSFCYFCQTSDRVPSQSPLRISSSWFPRVILLLW